MRAIDRITTERCGVPSLVLMENAAAATAQAIATLGNVPNKSILVLCGPGNNGGDGAATARLLAQDGAMVDVVLFGSFKDTKGDAQINFEKLKSAKLSVRLFECASADEWGDLKRKELTKPYVAAVDALFGTGLTRPLEGVFSEAVR